MTDRRRFLQLIAAATAARGAEPEKKNMIVRSARPEGFEMPLDGFGAWITPVERFFVRSHHYTPRVDPSSWTLELAGDVDRPQSLTMDDLKKLPRVEVTSVLECAGNGRSLYDPPLPGVQWVYGAVGNGRWAGVRLSDVLARAGVKSSAREILFDGADVPVGTMPEFQRSVPMKKALHPDTLLAYEMNGQPLPVSHGFPLRLVVPGWAGDSWAKWVTKLTVLSKEFEGFYMKSAYRHPGKPVTPGAAIDPAQMQPVETIAVKSIIASPHRDDAISGPVTISGAAWSGAATISMVEISVDRGRTWRRATLGRDQARYAWRLWQLPWTPAQPGHYVLMARATDGAGNMQPFVQEWNPSGYLNNVVHQVPVEVLAPGSKPPSASPAKPRAGTLSGFEQPRGYKSACLTCHEEDIIMQQRLTRVQWEREVDKMVRWGAKVDAADRAPIVEYLLKLYGPRPAE